MRSPIRIHPRRETRRIALLAGLVLVVEAPLDAQDPVTNGPAPTEEATPSLLRWETAAAGVLVLGALVGLDETIRGFAGDVQGNLGDDIASFGREYGDWKVTGPLFAGGSLLVGLVGDGGVGARRGAATIVGVFAGAMANETINQIVGRRRPGEERGPLSFDPFGGHASFGSGHAAYAFAMAAAVDEVTDSWLVAPLYGAATVTALSRVYHDRHWFSDIVFGSLMGYWGARQGARTAARAFGVGTHDSGVETRSSGPGANGASPWFARLEPVVSSNYLGVRLRF